MTWAVAELDKTKVLLTPTTPRNRSIWEREDSKDVKETYLGQDEVDKLKGMVPDHHEHNVPRKELVADMAQREQDFLARITDLENQLQDALETASRVDAIKELEVLAMDYAQKNADLEKTITNMKVSEDELLAQINKLLNELDVLSMDYAHKNSDLQLTITTMKLSEDELLGQIKRLQEETSLLHAPEESRYREMEALLEAHRHRNDELEDGIAAKDARIVGLETLTNRVQMAELDYISQITQLQCNVKDAVQESDKEGQHVTALVQQELQDALVIQARHNGELQAENQELQAQMKTLQTQMHDLQQRSARRSIADSTLGHMSARQRSPRGSSEHRSAQISESQSNLVVGVDVQCITRVNDLEKETRASYKHLDSVIQEVHDREARFKQLEELCGKSESGCEIGSTKEAPITREMATTRELSPSRPEVVTRELSATRSVLDILSKSVQLDLSKEFDRSPICTRRCSANTSLGEAGTCSVVVRCRDDSAELPNELVQATAVLSPWHGPNDICAPLFPTSPMVVPRSVCLPSVAFSGSVCMPASRFPVQRQMSASCTNLREGLPFRTHGFSSVCIANSAASLPFGKSPPQMPPTPQGTLRSSSPTPPPPPPTTSVLGLNQAAIGGHSSIRMSGVAAAVPRSRRPNSPVQVTTMTTITTKRSPVLKPTKRSNSPVGFHRAAAGFRSSSPPLIEAPIQMRQPTLPPRLQGHESTKYGQ